MCGCLSSPSNATEIFHTKWFEYGKKEAFFERMSAQSEEKPHRTADIFQHIRGRTVA